MSLTRIEAPYLHRSFSSTVRAHKPFNPNTIRTLSADTLRPPARRRRALYVKIRRACNNKIRRRRVYNIFIGTRCTTRISRRNSEVYYFYSVMGVYTRPMYIYIHTRVFVSLTIIERAFVASQRAKTAKIIFVLRIYFPGGGW